MTQSLIDEFTEFIGQKPLGIASEFASDCIMDTPLTGRVQGHAEVQGCLEQLTQFFAMYKASGKKISEVSSGTLVAGEALATLHKDSEIIHLPLAVVFEKTEKIRSIRLYHSRFPVRQMQPERSPLFESSVTAKLPENFSAYHEALRQGSVEKALALFSEDGTIREPSGHISGPGEPLRRFFESAFKEGGIHLIYHTFIAGEKITAAEYTCDHWGKTAIPPQSGMEFFEHDHRGKFHRVRIYDDVVQP